MVWIEDCYLWESDKETLTDGAIRGMLDSLGDKYTAYMDEATLTSLMEHVSGNVYGIGVYVALDDTGRIVVLDADGTLQYVLDGFDNNGTADTFSGPQSKLDKKMKEKLGFNDSSLHWDLINTENKTVTATLKDGSQKVIYEKGQFTY